LWSGFHGYHLYVHHIFKEFINWDDCHGGPWWAKPHAQHTLVHWVFCRLSIMASIACF
ncbi:Cobyric acid synthase, partial [Clarias magur]